ncbi:unnamed protein product [Linum tenue]|nr:unnamed protein product [Linum tenue]CAI0452682.1 unnamed protein product [Linum tenue]
MGPPRFRCATLIC